MRAKYYGALCAPSSLLSCRGLGFARCLSLLLVFVLMQQTVADSGSLDACQGQPMVGYIQDVEVSVMNELVVFTNKGSQLTDTEKAGCFSDLHRTIKELNISRVALSPVSVSIDRKSSTHELELSEPSMKTITGTLVHPSQTFNTGSISTTSVTNNPAVVLVNCKTSEWLAPLVTELSEYITTCSPTMPTNTAFNTEFQITRQSCW